MLKLITDQQGNQAILTTQVVEVNANWLAGQKIAPGKSKVWYRAYPLSGGAMLVQEGRFTVVGNVTQAHIDTACNGPFNPAAAAITTLWNAQ